LIYNFLSGGTSLQCRISGSSAQDQGHRNKKAYICVLFGLEILNVLTYKGYKLNFNLNLMSGCFFSETRCILWYSQIRVWRSSGQGQGHSSKKVCLCILFAGDLPSSERQSSGIGANRRPAPNSAH